MGIWHRRIETWYSSAMIMLKWWGRFEELGGQQMLMFSCIWSVPLDFDCFSGISTSQDKLTHNSFWQAISLGSLQAGISSCKYREQKCKSYSDVISLVFYTIAARISNPYTFAVNPDIQIDLSAICMLILFVYEDVHLVLSSFSAIYFLG